jgi:hypothetical protein
LDVTIHSKSLEMREKKYDLARGSGYCARQSIDLERLSRASSSHDVATPTLAPALPSIAERPIDFRRYFRPFASLRF